MRLAAAPSDVSRDSLVRSIEPDSLSSTATAVSTPCACVQGIASHGWPNHLIVAVTEIGPLPTEIVEFESCVSAQRPVQSPAAVVVTKR